MKVAMDVHTPASGPYVQVRDEHVLGIMLRPGSIEVGPQRSSMRRSVFTAGQMSFVPRRMERWVGAGHQERLLLGISDSALTAAREGTSGSVEVRPSCNVVDRYAGRAAELAVAGHLRRRNYLQRANSECQHGYSDLFTRTPPLFSRGRTSRIGTKVQTHLSVEPGEPNYNKQQNYEDGARDTSTIILFITV